ncbi:MAG: glycosyl hydrolase 115 family protein, partial [Cyclobacteriaceae bacterium]|nr:glycosyl hydrolase 115 family protein [Cyclobacteriaceae bacterium]
MRIFISIIFSLVSLLLLQITSIAQSSTKKVSSESDTNRFSLVLNNEAVSLFASATEHAGVLHALENLQQDIKTVTDKQPALIQGKLPKTKTIILAGTIGKNTFIDQLIKSKKLNVSDVTGKWETYVIQVVEKPFKGIEKALVIAGSDKRGTIFGIYEISKQIGVSPWHWWADVTPVKNQNISISAVRQYSNEPAVKYRGIFINDEQPALGGWVRENYGGFNSKFYTKVFDLILRLKGNFLWPAMWGQSFYTEDSLNPKLADEYGVVISTSHHEPMMRAHVEWQRYNKGKWNYSTNEVALREFWR